MPSSEKRFWYCFGTQEYLVKKSAADILQVYIESGIVQGEVTTVDGPVPDMEEIITASGTVSFFGGMRPILLAGIEPAAMTDAQVAELCELVPEVENAVLIAYTVFKDEKAQKTKKALKLQETAKAFGEATECRKLIGTALERHLAQHVSELGASFAPGAAALLIETCEDDLRLLQNESEKLAAAAGYGVITQEHVTALATRSMDASVFDMAAAILAKRGKEAFGILQKLLEEGQDEIAIAGALTSTYIDMYRVKLGAAAGKSYAAVHKDFAYKGSDWRLKKSAERARSYAPAQLREALGILARLDGELKSSAVKSRVLLESAVTQLLGV